MTPNSPAKKQADIATAPDGFGAGWNELLRQGQAPAATGGRTARETAEREATKRTRKKPLRPTEQRRRGRKISPHLPISLVAGIRRLCAAYGYSDEDGQGMIASGVINSILSLIVQLYQAGRLELTEQETTQPTRCLQITLDRGGSTIQAALSLAATEETEVISPTLSAPLLADLRKIAVELGHSKHGQGYMATELIQLLLETAVQLHTQGLLEEAEADLPAPRRQLRYKPRLRNGMTSVRQ